MEENKKTFAERHPKLNILLGLVLFAGIVATAIWLIKLFFNFVIDVIIKLTAIASRLDVVVIVALITGLVSIVSSIISKVIDYRKSRQEYLTQKREKPYGEFVEMIYRVQKNTKRPGTYSEKQMLEDLSKFSKKIALFK